MSHPLAIVIILITMFLTVRMRKLTLAAAIAGGCIGFFVFLGSSFTGLSIMAAFFLTGTAATSWKGKFKATLGIAEENNGQRTIFQVLANAGVAGFIGFYIHFFKQPPYYPLPLLIAASFSAATSDTLSSELGNIYGRNYYNIISFKKDQRGLNGVVSLEGTLAGLLGSAIIAIIFSIGFGWTKAFFWIVIAGLAGNLADSILGATLERKKLLDNNAVNFLNTCVAAIAALMLAKL